MMTLMDLLWNPDLPENCEVDLYLQKNDQDTIHIGKDAWNQEPIINFIENSVIEFSYNYTFKILSVLCANDN